MRKALHILARVAGALLVLLLVGLVVIQSSAVQTSLGREIVKRVQERTNADISFSLVSLRPFDALVLHDVVVADPEARIEGMDTLLYVGKLSAKFSIWGFLRGDGAYVSRLQLEDGCFNMAMEKDSLAPTGYNGNYRRVFGLPYTKNDKPFPQWGKLLRAAQVQVTDFRFRFCSEKMKTHYQEEGKVLEPQNIDWSDFTIVIDKLAAHSLKMMDSSITGDVTELLFHESRTGFRLTNAHLNGVRVVEDQVSAQDVLLDTEDSHILLQHLTLDGAVKEFSDFIERIKMGADFMPGSFLNLKTVSYFGPHLAERSFRCSLQGRVDGYVNDLLLTRLQVNDLDNDVQATISGRIVGLPETEETLWDLSFAPLVFTLGGLDDFVMGWSPGTRVNWDRYAAGEPFSFTGSMKGLMNQLDILLDGTSALGKIGAQAQLRNVLAREEHPLELEGQVQSDDLDLGRLIGNKVVGPVDLRSGLALSLDQGDMQVRIDSLQIDRLRLLDYDYTGISAAGTYREDAFDGRIVAADPNLNFMFQGLFNLSPRTRNAAYQFYASLGYADLHALHLDKREESKISLETSANFIRTQDRDLLGEVDVTDIILESETGIHAIGDIKLRAHANDDLHRIHIQAPFMDGSFVGDRPIGTFVSDLRALVLDRDLRALSPHPAQSWDGGSYEASLTLGNAQELLSFLVPGLWVEKGSTLALSLDKDGLVQGKLKSGRIALDKQYIKDVSLSLNNANDVLQAQLDGGVVSFSGGQLLDNRLRFFADDNRIGLGYTFDNQADNTTKAEVYITGELDRDSEGLGVRVQTLPSNIYYRGKGWGLSSGDIRYHAGNLTVDHLEARHEDEMLLLDGGYSPRKADTLRIQMEKFNIGLVNTFSDKIPPLEGKASGRALLLSSAQDGPGLLAGIRCDSTQVSGHPLGRLQIGSVWNDSEERFDIRVRNFLHEATQLDLDAFLQPSTRKLHALARLDRLDMGYAESLMSVLFTDFEGCLSGEIGVDGTLDRMNITSKDLRIDDGTLELEFTRVPYHVEGPLELDNKGLHFKRVRMSDGEQGRGAITGSIFFNDWKGFSFDTHIGMERMRVLKLQAGQNRLLYGNAYGSGRVDITGPLNQIFLMIDARVTDPGDVHIPVRSGGSDGKRELLTFTLSEEEQEEDAYEQMLAAREERRTRANDLRSVVRVQANPQLQLFLDVMGYTITGTGSGTVELESRTRQGLFTMNGDYTLSSGNFHFSVANLVTRDFTIQDGSSVRFNGDVWDTDLKVNGLYVTKASLGTLISDTEATSSSRRTVNCGIDISGKMRNPQVSFSIDIPDLNPSIQAEVESVLNTDDKIQKQFIYLLVAGNFLPGENSGISNGGTDVLFSNVSSIMSGQLNNIFQKLNIPLDLGLNYQTTQAGSNLFDVALSTQLFNNRVLVNGRVGNKVLTGGTTTNEIAGDVDIEIKLNRPGTLRLNLFTHSADQFTYFLDNSQRHGVGIAYQWEFDKQRYSRRRGQAQQEVHLQIDSTGHAIKVNE